MSLSQTQLQSLGKRDAAKWDKAQAAVAAADEKIQQIQATIADKKAELDKLKESLAKAKGVRSEKFDAKKTLAEDLKSAAGGPSSKARTDDD